MKRPIESEYSSHVSYTRALEEYCDALENAGQEKSIAGYCKKIEELIVERDNLRAALAQPEQEPVARIAELEETVRQLNHALREATEAPTFMGGPVSAEPIARIKDFDEYGPLLDWYKHWVNLQVGTRFYTTPPQRKQQEPEMHDAYCPALIGDECKCNFKKVVSVDLDDKKDAERYRWLKAQHEIDDDEQSHNNYGKSYPKRTATVFVDDGVDGLYPLPCDPGALDEFIDIAIKATNGIKG